MEGQPMQVYTCNTRFEPYPNNSLQHKTPIFILIFFLFFRGVGGWGWGYELIFFRGGGGFRGQRECYNNLCDDHKWYCSLIPISLLTSSANKWNQTAKICQPLFQQISPLTFQIRNWHWIYQWQKDGNY